MKSLNKILISLSLALFSITTIAQNNTESKRETMEKVKQDYILERMELTEVESTKMQALIAEYQEKMKAQRENKKETIKEMKEKRKEKMETKKEFTEEEARKILMNHLELEESRIQLEKEYTEKMIDAVSAQKTLEYKKLEREFKRELLEMLKDDEKKHHMRKEFERKRTRKEMHHQEE